MQPFNLERFKAGEPAYGKLTEQEHLYFGELPDGSIVTKYNFCGKLYINTHSFDNINQCYYMKERELTWDDVYEMWEKMDSRTCSNVYKWLKENCEPPKLKKK